MEVSNLNTLSRRINILLLFIACQSGRTAAIACQMSFARITCCNFHNSLPCFLLFLPDFRLSLVMLRYVVVTYRWSTI